MSIVFEHVSYTYDSHAQSAALSDVNLTIESNSFTGLIGHTGSGKSTLIEHMCGLKLPGEGTVYVDGVATSTKKGRSAARKAVGFVSQYPEYQLFAETVFDDVAFGPKNHGIPQEEIVHVVSEALTKVGLSVDKIGSLSPFELSGGQQRRVAIAGILAMKPHTIVLDEPLAGLDPRGRKEIMSLLQQLHNEGATLVMVSHSMDDIAEYADKIVVLNEGSVLTEGTPSEVFCDRDQLVSVGLDVPESTALSHELKQRGINLGNDLIYTIDDLANKLMEFHTHKQGAQTHGV